jgi:hypothetical protein
MAGIALIALVLLVAVVAVIAPATAKGGALPVESKTIVIAGKSLNEIIGGKTVLEKCTEYYGEKPANDVVCYAIIEFIAVNKGTRYQYSFNVYNSSLENTTFSLKLQPMPEINSRPGYVPAPDEAMKWLVLRDTVTGNFAQHGELLASIGPQEWRTFDVFLEIPKSAASPPKWEFRIRVNRIHGEAGGLIAIARNLRGVVDMRE